MGRRNSATFIPGKDREFASMAILFARAISRDPARLRLSASDADEIRQAVMAFHEALRSGTRKSTRTEITINKMDQARKSAEAIVRKFGNIIRGDARISTMDKMRVRVKERPKKLNKRKCPKSPPIMMFDKSKRGTDDAARNGGIHILRYQDQLGSGTRAKPAGAARLELFVELVAPGEPIPRDPNELSGGRPWYLRSYSKSPIEVKFPVPATPMLVVYWGRWADGTGEVGPYSETLVACVEGWSVRPALADDRENQTNRRVTVTIARHALEDQTETREIESIVAALPVPAPIRSID